MINVLLVGYGKMGKLIKEHVDQIEGQVVDIYDLSNPVYAMPLAKRNLNGIDVAIEFTHPQSAFENVKELLSRKIPVVSGTTGWWERLEEIKSLFHPREHTLIYGANFSVGMNLFYKIIEYSSQLIGNQQLYDLSGLEAHHRQKFDAPSGTARVLCETIQKNFIGKTEAVFDLHHQPLQDHEFCFTSIRSGNIVGLHEIRFDSEFDEIKLTHNAKNRLGYALGAIYAAKYALCHSGYYNFQDIFSDVMSKK